MVTLSNVHLSLVISEHGAEMHSLKNKHTGIEYIWNGNPTYWPRHAPILFPMSGPTKEDKISVDGTEYPMPGNGFARDLDWTLVGSDEESATFTLEDNETTHGYFPFGFKLTTTYTLDDDEIDIKTVIESKTNDMRFVYALHPAFMLDINRNAQLDDYMISFSDEEDVEKLIKVGPLFKDEGKITGKLMKLCRADLDQGAIALKDLSSKKVSLLCGVGNHGVELSLGDLHTLVCWSPEGKKAPFVCVEPMLSFGDTSRPMELKQMDGLAKLNAGQKKVFTNTIRPF